MKTARVFSNDFNRIISATKDFVSHSSNKPSLQYIKLEFDAEQQKVTAIAIDGYRMSVENAVISHCDESFSVYVKGNIKLPTKQYAVFSLDGDEGEVVIRCGEFIFGYRQPSATEINWKRMIPSSDVTYKIGFNGNYLLSALQAAKVSCGSVFKSPVVLEFRTPNEPILLRTNSDDIKMVLPIRMSGN